MVPRHRHEKDEGERKCFFFQLVKASDEVLEVFMSGAIFRRKPHLARENKGMKRITRESDLLRLLARRTVVRVPGRRHLLLGCVCSSSNN